jgi:hypothetical protein
LLREHFQLALAEVYATNVFPFIKRGNSSSSISGRDFERAACEFAIPQIDIVGPRLVICLRLKAFKGLRSALRKPRLKTLGAAIDDPFSYGTI